MKNNACEQYPFYKKLEQCPDYERAAANLTCGRQDIGTRSKKAGSERIRPRHNIGDN